MNPKNTHSLLHPQGNTGQRTRQPLARIIQMQNLTDKTLARGAKEQGITQGKQFIELLQQAEIPAKILAKPDTRIKSNGVRGNSRR